MPIVIIALILIILFAVVLVTLALSIDASSRNGGVVTGFLICLIVFVGSLIWIFVASSVTGESFLGTYELIEGDGCQLILIGDSPYNITKLYGRNFPKETKIEVREVNRFGGGINWMKNPRRCRPILNGNELADWVKIESKK